MVDCIEAASIPICMVGLLTALPNTQMTRRLEREGRLFPGYDAVLPERGDQCTAGLNFIPARPRRDILQDYKEVLEKIYAPAAFFHRLTTVGQALRRPALGIPPSRAAVAKDLAILARVAWRLTIHRPALARRFWRLLLSCARSNLPALEYVMMMMVIYLHVGPFATHVIADLETQIAAIDRGERSETMRVGQDQATNRTAVGCKSMG
jgi:hypothetical protein